MGLGRVTVRVVGLAIAALGMGCPAAWGSKDSVPDWVREASRQTLPAYPAQTNAVIVLDQTTYSVDSGGQGWEHVRRVTKILRPKGREEGVVGVGFDKDTKIMSMHVWSIGPDGHEYALNDKDLTDRGSVYGNMLDGYFVRVGVPPGRDPGGFVAYEYEQRMRPYLKEKTWFLQDDVPRLRQSFTLVLPPGFTYGTVWAHRDQVKPEEMAGADLENRKYRWELANTPAIDLDRVPMHPSQSSLAGRMTVHYGPAGEDAWTWKRMGEWYETISRERLAASPEIAAKAAELTAGRTDFYEKTEPIAEYVQKQVRYFAVELGIGGLQPHAAGETFKRQYGDCKDKATLLSAMLSSVGVHAALVMVSTERGVIDPEAPSMVGNHMIAAIEVPKGYESAKLRSVVTSATGRRYLIFDPTWEKTAFGQLESNLQGGYGVLMENHDSQVIQLPVLSPALNRIDRTGNFQVLADGSLKGLVTEKRFGDVSVEYRRFYARENLKEQHDFMDRALGGDFASYVVSDVKVENVNLLNKDFTTTYGLTAERFGKTTGGLLMVRPRVLGQDGFWTDTEPRKVAIDLKETLQARDEFDLELPEGYAMDEMPEPVKYDAGFASYESSSEMKGNKLHYTRTYTVREVSLPPERYGEVQKLAGIINADEHSRAVLKKTR